MITGRSSFGRGLHLLKQLAVVGVSCGLIVIMSVAAAPQAVSGVEMGADHQPSTVGVMVGWGAVGVSTGGTNPVSYSLANWQLPAALVVWLDQHEIYASVFPGIYYSWRTAATGFYVTLGGGIALAYNGVDGMIVPGIAAGMGYNYCFLRYLCLGIEYKNSLGFDSFWFLPRSILASHWSVRTHLGVMFAR